MPSDYGSYIADDPETSDAMPEDKQDNADDGGEKNALVPKAFCPQGKVGDTITATIVAEHEGEFELQYEDSHSPDEEKGPGEPEPDEAKAEMDESDGMRSMMQ